MTAHRVADPEISRLCGALLVTAEPRGEDFTSPAAAARAARRYLALHRRLAPLPHHYGSVHDLPAWVRDLARRYHVPLHDRP